jgi:hypothetical protein
LSRTDRATRQNKKKKNKQQQQKQLQQKQNHTNKQKTATIFPHAMFITYEYLPRARFTKELTTRSIFILLITL